MVLDTDRTNNRAAVELRGRQEAEVGSVRLVSVVDADELDGVSESPGQINDARALSKCRETDFDERGKYG